MLEYLKILVISVLPIFELRGSIPLGVAMGLDPIMVLICAYVGSLLPAPFILLGMKPIFDLLRQTRMFQKLIDWISHRTIKKSKNVSKYGFWGLVLFVATPLPGTGVWSGSLAASLLNMKFKKSILAILLGNLLAGLILYTISYLTILRMQ